MNTATTLFGPPVQSNSDSRRFINQNLWFEDRDGYRVVFDHCTPIYSISLSDKAHRKSVAVFLRLGRHATQEEIAEAFEHSVAAQRRWERSYQQQGWDSFSGKPGAGRPAKVQHGQEAFVRKWFEQGLANRQIARQLGVDEATVRRVLKRLGLKRPDPQGYLDFPQEDTTSQPVAEDEDLDQEQLANTGELSSVTESDERTAEQPVASSEMPKHQSDTQKSEVVSTPRLPKANNSEPVLTFDSDPLDRSVDRLMASQGLLEDAAPLFIDVEALPRAGVLLAITLFVRQRVLEVFGQVYGSLGPAFYGLRTMVVVLLLCALLRIKRPEQLKEYFPPELGRLIGLDRFPEVKTVRRKLAELAGQAKARELMDSLAQQRITAQEDRAAFLYLDGHVREYHGKACLSKTKKSQRSVATPATTDTWVHDAAGEPLLVIPAEMNQGLTQVLEPILKDVRRLIGPERRVTVIFDRGGFSARLFARLIELGFDVLTYRKGSYRSLPDSHFKTLQFEIDGWCYSYQIVDQSRVRVGRLRPRRKRRRRSAGPQFLWMRQVTVLRDDGRQTHILTNRTDLSAAAIPYWMFGRWRQENYFKYMATEFDLDGLIEYGAEAVSEELDRPNPAHVKLRKQLDKAKARVHSLAAELGSQAASNAESQRPTMRGFKIAHADLREQLKEAQAKVDRLKEELSQTPKRISATGVQKLKQEKKMISDTIKLTAYQVESALLGILHKYYARSLDEGRTFLHAVFQSSARLEVTEGELRVTISAQSSPHRTKALAELCAEINSLEAMFPGTELRIRLAVDTD